MSQWQFISGNIIKAFGGAHYTEWHGQRRHNAVLHNCKSGFSEMFQCQGKHESIIIIIVRIVEIIDVN